MASENPDAQSLSQQFVEATDILITLLERCDSVQWRATCPEGWSVGVVATHVGGSFRFITGLVELLAANRPLPEVTSTGIDEGNARYAAKHADCDQEQTIAALRTRSETATQVLRGLTDAQLSHGASFTLIGGRVATACSIIESMLIDHVKSHCASIEAAIGRG